MAHAPERFAARYNFLHFPQGRPCGRPPAALRPGNDTTVTGVPASPSTSGDADAFEDFQDSSDQAPKHPTFLAGSPSKASVARAYARRGSAGAHLGHDPRDSSGHLRTASPGRSPARTPLPWTLPGGMPSMACKGSGVQIPLSSTTTSQQVTGLPLPSATLLAGSRLPDSCHRRAT